MNVIQNNPDNYREKESHQKIAMSFYSSNDKKRKI